MKNNRQKSFTLIELLVVIAIIGALSSILLPNFMGARERARDAQRKSDLKQIQKALEMYKQDQRAPLYPTPYANNPANGIGTCSNSFEGTSVYLNKMPCDPLGPTPYFFKIGSTDNQTYKLCSCLENQADPDGESPSNCDSTFSCPTNKKGYVVNEP